MINLIANAIPFFLMSVAVEAWALRHHAHDHEATTIRGAVGYEAQGHPDQPADGRRSPRSSTRAGSWSWPPPTRRSTSSPRCTWTRATGGSGCCCSSCDDLAYYTYHRAHHRIRRVLGHPRRPPQLEHYNLSTALRQNWTPFVLDLLLGAAGAARLPAVDDLPGDLLEPALPVLDPHREDRPAARAGTRRSSTRPSHHRVHHGSQRAVPRPQLRRRS